MRIRKSKGNEDTQSKQCLRLMEYKYQQGIGLTKKKSSSARISINEVVSVEQSPLKILKQKISINLQNNIKTQAQNQQKQVVEEINTDQLYKRQQQKKQMQFKKMITPRDVLFQPRRSVFNRFNYQNYENYSYKNPFKPNKYPIDDKIMQGLKNNPNHATNKNLQIIFCQHKYKDFVEKSNKQFEKFYQTSRQFPIVQSSRKKKSFSQLSRNYSESKMQSMTSRNFKKRKTTLSNYLQQFITLEKLTQYMIRQHKLNEKYLLFTVTDATRTVLLDVLIHRFQFLKKMKKKARDFIFKILWGDEALNPLFKINIQDYIKFIQIFVSRDAEITISAYFVIKFLFKNQQVINMEVALSSLDLLAGTAKKHKIVEDRLNQILTKSQCKIGKLYQLIRKNQSFIDSVISLIIDC